MEKYILRYSEFIKNIPQVLLKIDQFTGGPAGIISDLEFFSILFTILTQDSYCFFMFDTCHLQIFGFLVFFYLSTSFRCETEFSDNFVTKKNSIE